MKVDRSYPEVGKDGDGSRNHVISPPAAQHPYFDRARHVHTDDFEREWVEIHPVPMEIGHELVWEVLMRAAALPAFPKDPLSEVGKAGFEMKLEEKTLDGGGEAVVSSVLVAMIHDEFRDSATRKEDRVDLSVWKLDRFLKTAADPKNPLRIGERIKFPKRERWVQNSV